MFINTLVEFTTILANLLLSAGVFIAIFQLYQMKKSNDLQAKSMIADLERRKKQSTLEYYTNIYPRLSELRTSITETFEDGYITPNDERYAKNLEIQKIIYEYLVILERFAVGVNAGIYDINVFSKTSGKVVNDMFRKLSPIIENLRITLNYPEMFNEFEKLCKNIEITRAKMYPKLQEEDLVSIKYGNFE